MFLHMSFQDIFPIEGIAAKQMLLWCEGHAMACLIDLGIPLTSWPYYALIENRKLYKTPCLCEFTVTVEHWYARGVKVMAQVMLSSHVRLWPGTLCMRAINCDGRVPLLNIQITSYLSPFIPFKTRNGYSTLNDTPVYFMWEAWHNP